MKKFVAFSIVAALLTSASAFAQGRSAGTSHVPNPDQVMTFSDELVRGDLVRPDVTTVRGNRAPRGISLLRVRQHFVQEMLKTVENF